ncbi:alpha/beta hydrolase [bacterium]|nr:alpha/beta hydrolase [Rubripirellula sp.]MDB4338844.1 alpha/beta hydrolase [Rubripirellula sp.]MDC0278839.1 alpha/beta hydrolase [bacterium]
MSCTPETNTLAMPVDLTLTATHINATVIRSSKRIDRARNCFTSICKRLIILAAVCCISQPQASAETPQPAVYQTLNDQSYRNDTNLADACQLDLYYPTNRENYATVIWFHGGGLTSGKRSIPTALKNQGIAVATVDYRLCPKVTVRECLDDAAASVAWVFQQIEKYGGSKNRIFLSGHSAGGYLTSMIGLDKSLLSNYKIDADDIAGLIPYSGHTITHFTARKELGLTKTKPLINDLAPLYHVRPSAAPILFITGDRELEMLGRYEENAYMWRMMQAVGHPDAKLYELDGYNHGKMAIPAHPLLLRFIERVLKEKN